MKTKLDNLIKETEYDNLLPCTDMQLYRRIEKMCCNLIRKDIGITTAIDYVAREVELGKQEAEERLLNQSANEHDNLVRKEYNKYLLREIEKLKINVSGKVAGDDFVSNMALNEVKKHEWSYNSALNDIKQIINLTNPKG